MSVLDIPRFVQIMSICGGILGVIFGFVLLIEQLRFLTVIFYGFVILLFSLLILTEIYVPEIFKYAAFLLTIWGKGVMFLFLGFFEFTNHGVGLAAGIIFWSFFVVYQILHFVIGKSALPILQRQIPPIFELNTEDFFAGETVPDLSDGYDNLDKDGPPPEAVLPDLPAENDVEAH
jgi:hypothetical protein